MHIWEKLQGLTFYFLFFSFSSPSPSHLPPLGKNYVRIYTPDSLLSCVIRLISKFLNSFALAPLSIFLISFPSYFFSPSFAFLLLFSFPFSSFARILPFLLPFHFPSLPLFYTLLWFSSLALRAFDSSPPWGDYRRIYTPAFAKSPFPSFPFTHFVFAALGRELYKNIHPR